MLLKYKFHLDGDIVALAAHPDNRRVISAVNVETEQRSIKEFKPLTWLFPATSSLKKSGIVQVWEISSGNCLHKLNNSSVIWEMIIHPDGKRLILRGDNLGLSSLYLWDLNSGKSICDMEGAGAFKGLLLSPDGRRIKILTKHREREWDIDRGICLYENHGELMHEDACTLMAYHPDGKRLIKGDWFSLKVINNESGTHESLLDGYSGKKPVECYDGNNFVARVSENAVMVRNLENGKSMRFGGYEEIISIAIRYPFLVTGSTSKTLRVWNLASGKPVTRLIVNSSICRCAVSLPGHIVFIDDAGDISFCELEPEELNLIPTEKK